MGMTLTSLTSSFFLEIEVILTFSVGLTSLQNPFQMVLDLVARLAIMAFSWSLILKVAIPGAQ